MSERVLFVHGAAGDARIWQPVIAALDRGLQGTALTLTYFGSEPWPDDGRNFGTAIHTADIQAAARAAEGPVHLVSWSYGVHPAIAAVLDQPELFASALFFEGALPHYFRNKAQRTAYFQSWQELFSPVVAAIEDGGGKAGIEALLGKAASFMSAERIAIYRENAAMMPLLFGKGQEPAPIGPTELATIALPCCVALGADTHPTFALPTRALATAIPGAKLLEIAKAHHFMPEFEPVRFAQLVSDWVNGISAGG